MMPHLDLAVVNGAFSYTGRYVARTGCACTHTLTLTVELDSPPREGTTSPEGTTISATGTAPSDGGTQGPWLGDTPVLAYDRPDGYRANLNHKYPIRSLMTASELSIGSAEDKTPHSRTTIAAVT